MQTKNKPTGQTDRIRGQAKSFYEKSADEQRASDNDKAESERLGARVRERDSLLLKITIWSINHGRPASDRAALNYEWHDLSQLTSGVFGRYSILGDERQKNLEGSIEFLKTSEASKVAAAKSKAEGDKLTKELKALERETESEKVEADIKAHALMFNAIYDFKNKSPITPYMGFGIGSAWVNSEGLDAFNSPEFAYQFMAGLSVGTFKGIEVFTGYRYLSTFDIHIAELGLRYNF